MRVALERGPFLSALQHSAGSLCGTAVCENAQQTGRRARRTLTVRFFRVVSIMSVHPALRAVSPASDGAIVISFARSDCMHRSLCYNIMFA